MKPSKPQKQNLRLLYWGESLAARASEKDVSAGTAAADPMNAIILEGIRALSLASYCALTAGDIRDHSDWIAAERSAIFS